MSISEIYNTMSAFTRVVGNGLIVGGIAGLVLLGRAIYKAYAPEEWR